MYGDWTHATMGASVAALRECYRGFDMPRRVRKGNRVKVYPGSIAVVAVCAIAAFLFDHSLLTSAGIGSLGLDAWRLLGRQVDSLRSGAEKTSSDEGSETP